MRAWPRPVRRALDRLARLDASMRPYRWRLAGGLAAVACAAHHFDVALDTAHAATTIGAALLVASTSALALARIAALRGDDGAFSFSECVWRARACRRAIEEHARLFGASTPAHKRRLVGVALAFWGFAALFAVEAAAIGRAVGRWLDGARPERASSSEAIVASVATAVFFAGWIVVAWTRRRSRNDAHEEGASLESIFRARSPVLPADEAVAAAKRFDGRAGDLLAAIAAWPTPAVRSLTGCAAHLGRHLERTLAGTELVRAPDLGDAVGPASRFALIAGDTLVVVEREAMLRRQERARAALQRYRDAWRGPILVAVVEPTDDEGRARVAKSIAAIPGEPRLLGIVCAGRTRSAK